MPVPPDETARLLENTRVLYHLQRYADVEATARKLLAREPKSWKGHYYLASALLYQKGAKSPEGLKEAEATVGLCPESADSHFLLSWAHLLRHKPREALAAAQPGLRIAPQDAYGNYVTAWAYKQLHQWEQVLRIVREALRFNPEYVRLLNLHAEALIMLGRTAEAGEAIARVLHQDPVSPLAHHYQGVLLLLDGQPEQAELQFREALRLSPRFSLARWGLAKSAHVDYWFYRFTAYFYAFIRPTPSEFWASLFPEGGISHSLRSAAEKYPPVWIVLLPHSLLYLFSALLHPLHPLLFKLLLSWSPVGR